LLALLYRLNLLFCWKMGKR